MQSRLARMTTGNPPDKNWFVGARHLLRTCFLGTWPDGISSPGFYQKFAPLPLRGDFDRPARVPIVLLIGSVADCISVANILGYFLKCWNHLIKSLGLKVSAAADVRQLAQHTRIQITIHWIE